MTLWPFAARKQNESGIAYGGFTDRLLSSAVDSFISLVLFAPLFFWLNGWVMNGLDFQAMMAQAVAHQQSISGETLTPESQRAAVQYLFAELSRTGFWARWLTNYALQLLVMMAAIVTCWHFWAATPGKKLLRLRIVDAETLGAPRLSQYLLRCGAYFLSLLPLLLGFFWIGWDSKKQGWHDKIAGTLVIRGMGRPRNIEESP